MIRRVKTCHKLVTWGTSRRHFWAPKNQEAPLHLYSEGFLLKWRLLRLGRGVRNRNSQNTGIAGMRGGGLTLAWIFVKDLSTCTEGPQR